MLRSIVAALVFLASTSVGAVEPLSTFNLVLLQPSTVLEERVPKVDDMAAYIRSVETAAQQALVASKVRQSTSGFIVVAVRPGPQSRVWLDFDTMLDLDLRRQITEAVQAVKPFQAQQGPVVFALKVGLWGGQGPKRPLPSPPEWKQAARGGPAPEIGQLVDALWDE